ncbi:MAG: hypothetical protein M3O46_14430 [Myxococcota bacterium]|nr:hypothetical protein [Myxococcota bacterium]
MRKHGVSGWVCIAFAAALGCSGAGPSNGGSVNGDAAGPSSGSSGGSSSGGNTGGSSGGSSSGGISSSSGSGGGSSSGATSSGSGSGASTGDGGTGGSSGSSSGGGSGGADAGVMVGTTASIDATGKYTIVFQKPAWTFGGSLGVAPTQVMNATGSDGVGAYHEVTFNYSDTSAKTGAIRTYDTTPVVLFTVNYVAAGSNGADFPALSTYPKLPLHLTYGEVQFAPFSFSAFNAHSPWVYFDANANAFIVSPANHFMNAATSQSTTAGISSGVDPGITTIPAGFSYKTVLVAQPSINAAYDAWGNALTGWSGKKRPASDATKTLERFGYWTDNGATYYYNYDMAKGYPGTMVAVRDYYKTLNIPLAYIQLDSWWYGKGAGNIWTDKAGGQFLYAADKTLFPNDLPAFQTSLAVPLITHSRWIDANSPYRTQYKMSNNVSIDPAYWTAIATYLAASGVATYEQDWMNINALPATNNLTDQDAFLDNMASAMEQKGLSIQYCMGLPRHYLQSSKYNSVMTTRANEDHFVTARWQPFLYTSRLASAVGEWPWTDVFRSSEEDNLILATLSAGMVGVGDAIGGASAANIFKSVMPDGVIVKPDVPIVPVDQTFVNDAQGGSAPKVAATYTDFRGLRASYVFSFGSGSASFTGASLGYSGKVFVYKYFQGTGSVVDSTAAYTEPVASGRAYDIVVPVGPSGIAMVGDAGKYVSLGKKRVTQLADNGTVSMSLAFASGEGPVSLKGYAAAQPMAVASVGTVGPVTYDATTKLFTVSVTQAGGTAMITLH